LAYGSAEIVKQVIVKKDEKNLDHKGLAKKQKIEQSEKADGLAKFKLFRYLSKYVFDEIDTDKSGGVDEQELYTGLLLLHLYLASYLGPAAAKPASRQKVSLVFHMMDKNKNGILEEDEFLHAMAILCSHLVSRLAILMCLTVVLVPILTQHIFMYISYIGSFIFNLISRMDVIHRITSYVGCTSDTCSGDEISMNLISSCAEACLGYDSNSKTNALMILFLTVETFITCLIYQYFGAKKALPYAITKLALAKNHFLSLPISTIAAAPRTIVSLALGYIIIPQVAITIDKKFDTIAKYFSSDMNCFGGTTTIGKNDVCKEKKYD